MPLSDIDELSEPEAQNPHEPTILNISPFNRLIFLSCPMEDTKAKTAVKACCHQNRRHQNLNHCSHVHICSPSRRLCQNCQSSGALRKVVPMLWLGDLGAFHWNHDESWTSFWSLGQSITFVGFSKSMVSQINLLVFPNQSPCRWVKVSNILGLQEAEKGRCCENEEWNGSRKDYQDDIMGNHPSGPHSF